MDATHGDPGHKWFLTLIVLTIAAWCIRFIVGG